MGRRNPSILYISYDGILEPLGQSQVLGYLAKLADDHAIQLISFEKEKDRGDRARMRATRERLRGLGIRWIPLAYHKTPSVPATAYDIAVGTIVALWVALRYRVRLVHARSYVPALMALAVKRLTGARFLFDMRGFWADERTDGGLWPKGGRLYRAAKALERRFLLSADYAVTLTRASAYEIGRFPYLQDRAPPIGVIPTCADLARFRPLPAEPGWPFTFGYVGSFGTWYLLDETLQFFKAVASERPDARLLIVNRNEHAMVRAAAAKAGIGPDRLELVAAEHSEVPRLIARMDAAGAIIKPCYSKMASAPTKLAEYLGCGVPCVGNVGVGDIEQILEGNRVGVALPGFAPAAIEDAARRLLMLTDDPDTASRCVETARRLFSLDIGADAYRAIYASLIAAPEIAASRPRKA